METYIGDTFKFDFNATLEDGTTYDFYAGDILKVGIKDRLSSSVYVALKQIQIEETTDVVNVEFSKDETARWSTGNKILEVELTDTQGNVTTLYQDKLTVLGDVIK